MNVAIVLHAHLPYVGLRQGCDDVASLWLPEAMWECYRPLVAMLERLAREGVKAAITVSLSPPLLAMWRDRALMDRCHTHAEHLLRLSEMVGAPFIRERLELPDADVLARLVALHRAHAIELITTSATHAYLPGLAVVEGAVAAQLRIGLQLFHAATGLKAAGMWLPECAYEPRVGDALARLGVGFTVLDQHALPSDAIAGPVTYFARHAGLSRAVWARRGGYPGDPAYREFHRDIGHERELAPFSKGTTTGLKVHRIDGGRYDPAAADERIAAHAEDFLHRCRQANAQPLLAAYDAELFGHWWWEGPSFLERVLRKLAAAPDLEAVSLSSLATTGTGTPASSSWGAGGYHTTWMGLKTARLWRHIHQAHRAVQAQPNSDAIRELLLLEASDWPFMIHNDRCAGYAEGRFRQHWTRLQRLLAGEQCEPSRFARDIHDLTAPFVAG